MTTWKEQIKQQLYTADQLKPLLSLSDAETKRLDAIIRQYPMAIPPYYFSLIDPDDPKDPIRKMCVPAIEEFDPGGKKDTSGEASNTVVPGLQHKYKQTALILSNDYCAMYCRHCFRKRLVGLDSAETCKDPAPILSYIRNHPEILNVLISGGDAFLNSNTIIRQYLEALTSMDHIEAIRFGTRTLVVIPMRIYEDEELLSLLTDAGRKKQIYVVTQFNHPKELTPEARKAISALKQAGLIVRNQTVLLKGINDSGEVLGRLLRMLVFNGVVPYYVFQCRPVEGVHGQFQVPLLRGYEIIRQAMSMQSGLGKCFRYVLSHETGKIEILGPGDDGRMLFKYHQAKYETDTSRIFAQKLDPDQCWPVSVQSTGVPIFGQ